MCQQPNVNRSIIINCASSDFSVVQFCGIVLKKMLRLWRLKCDVLILGVIFGIDISCFKPCFFHINGKLSVRQYAHKC